MGHRWSTLAVTLISLSAFAAPTYPQDAPVQERTKYVVIESENNNVELIQIRGGAVAVSGGYAFSTSFYKSLCMTPCQENFPATSGDRYILAGDGVTPTAPFHLAHYQDAVTIQVKAGSSGLRTGGALMVTTGILGVVTGGTLLLVQMLAPSSNSGLLTAGAITTASGGGLLIGGIIMGISSRTRYILKKGVAPAKGTQTNENSI
jgi:hypothetical protein